MAIGLSKDGKWVFNNPVCALQGIAARWLSAHYKTIARSIARATVICHLMYPAKSLAMYPFWGFFRLLKVGTKLQQCTKIGNLADDVRALCREGVP